MTTSNHSDDDQEMSMDEILASIRRYVSPEDLTPKSAPKSTEPVVGSPQLNTDVEPHTQRITPHLDMSRHEDSVRVSESVKVESPRSERQESSLWTEEPLLKPSFEPNKQEPYATRSTIAPLKQPNQLFKPSTDGLVSDKTLSTTMESFSRLRDASAPKTQTQEETKAPSLNPTLDQLFESLARPMIRDWLDRHLPPMVERMVAREIERITKG